jgi:SNF2 family DNA or RNA helicase
MRTLRWKDPGQTAQTAVDCSKTASKVLLLTATPVVNRPDDILNLIRMTNSNAPDFHFDAAVNFKQLFLDEDRIKDYIKCMFSFYKDTNIENYPTRKNKNVFLKMSNAVEAQYKEVESSEIKNKDLEKQFGGPQTRLAPFYNGIRRASNNLDLQYSKKINWIIDRLVEPKEKMQKMLIYSHFLGSGINLLRNRLDKMNISYSVITGSTSTEDRAKAVMNYNKDKLKIILLSKAGGEGLDLKGTRNVVLLEPSWNEAVKEQVIGRAIRYASHQHLPEKDRNVTVWSLLLMKKDDYKQRETILAKVKTLEELREYPTFLSADIRLNIMSIIKQKDIKKFLAMLEMSSIENDKDCYRQQKKNLKFGPDEKKSYVKGSITTELF